METALEMDVLLVSSAGVQSMKIVDKQQLEKLYLEELVPLDFICKELHITIETLRYNLNYYSLSRDTSKMRSIKQSERYKKQRETLDSCIDPEEIKRFYIDENHTYQEVIDKYGITGWSLDIFLRENGIKKSRKQSASLVLKSKYEKAGGKEAYDKAVHDKIVEGVSSKYGSYDAYKEHLSKKCKEAWGTELKERQADWIKNNYHNSPEKLEHAKEVRAKTNLERYGVPNTYSLAEFTANSKYNLKFASMLDACGVSYEQEFSLKLTDGHLYRYDFKCGNTLIELNPWPFHNTTFTPSGASVVSKNYHRDKTHFAIDNGYRVINVWDWDSLDKVVNLLKTRDKVFARKCVVREVNKVDAVEFIETNHLQGYSLDKVRLGLYCNNELVSIMTFGKPRYSKKYEWELVRYCSSKNVVGGALKLFKHFLSQYKPKSIVSYCDTSKFTGSVYKELGFEEVSTSISKHWYNINTKKHILDSSLRMKGFDILLGEQYGYFGKGTSNEELMRQHGFVEIYDAGQTTYRYKGDNDNVYI